MVQGTSIRDQLYWENLQGHIRAKRFNTSANGHHTLRRFIPRYNDTKSKETLNINKYNFKNSGRVL